MIVCFRNGRPSGRADAFFASPREARRLVDFKFLSSELESQILKPPCNLKFMTLLTPLLLFVIYSRAAEKMHRRDLGSRYFFPRLKSNVSNIKIFHH